MVPLSCRTVIQKRSPSLDAHVVVSKFQNGGTVHVCFQKLVPKPGVGRELDLVEVA